LEGEVRAGGKGCLNVSAHLFVFTGTSLLCGVAPSMNVLIVGRALAGLGGGAILSLSLIIIADYVPIAKRGLYAGMIGACFAVASVAGPLLGGVFTGKSGAG